VIKCSLKTSPADFRKKVKFRNKMKFRNECSAKFFVLCEKKGVDSTYDSNSLFSAEQRQMTILCCTLLCIVQYYFEQDYPKKRFHLKNSVTVDIFSKHCLLVKENSTTVILMVVPKNLYLW
jgi:hypothetical protein